MTKESVKFCPQCGSSALDFSGLIGGAAACRGCRWSGDTDELLSVPITHEFVGKEEMLVVLMNDLRKVLPSIGPSLLKLLLDWGFLDGDLAEPGSINSGHFSRYLAAGCQAWLSSILATREALEQERVARRLGAS